ncbi:MAG TPA: outer membrane beta-barrel protein [bacterium]|nr:outer membrane beta-barrel protein [bacterium]
MKNWIVATLVLSLPAVARAADPAPSATATPAPAATVTATPAATATPLPTQPPPPETSGAASAVGTGGSFSKNEAPRQSHREEAPASFGLFGGLDLGFHHPDGTYYGGDLQNGFAFNLRLGWRFGRFFSLETGIYEGLTKVKNGGPSGGIAEIGTIDARWWFASGSAVEPNLLLGYTLASGVSLKQSGVSETLAGGSTNLGAGVRWTIAPQVFMNFDYRHMFIRFTKENISGAGAGLDGTYSLPRQYHGDDDAFLVGGGIQF